MFCRGENIRIISKNKWKLPEDIEKLFVSEFSKSSNKFQESYSIIVLDIISLEMKFLDQNFYKELQQMSRDDEMRAKVMIRGLREILKDKKEENLVKKLNRKKTETIPHWK